MKINELLDGISKRDIVLPEFQREYVWGKDKAKQLVVSLVKDYPVGGLLFWKTDSPPDLKNVSILPEKLGMISVILDGQQRLTTLYMLVRGEIPPYYTETDIETDPRDLYYDLETGDFQYYLVSRMKDNPLWIQVTKCFQSKEINVFQIAQNGAPSEGEAFQRAQRYNTNLTRLRNIETVDLPMQTVPSHASLNDAITIFDRVNSLGTKLTDAELALTHVTGNWPQARRVMKDKISDLEAVNFGYDLTFMIRALTGVVTKRALFETIHDRPRPELEQGWNTLSKALDYLAGLLPESAFVHSTLDLNTTNVLVPLVVYLSLHKGRFPSDKALKRAIHWLYAAHTKARYTSQTDQKLEHDVSLVVANDSPWELLVKAIMDERGRLETTAGDMEGRTASHPLFRMTYILAKAHGAIDWFNGSSLAAPVGKAYALHYHHIFPSSILYKHGYDPENLLDKKIVNEIGNHAFLTAESNQSISNRLPEQYLPEVEERFPGALARQFVPVDPSLWKLDHFPVFLEARRGLIARKMNEYMQSLISEPEIVHERSIKDLIGLGESATLEFKTTLQWDVVQNQPNKALRKQVLKTVAAFLNSEGGTLVIGVEDNGGVYGLERDFGVVDNSRDRFQNLLSSLMTDYIGPEFASLVKLRFETVNSHQVCVIDVSRGPIPAYIRGDQGSEFYVRVGSTSRALDTEETVRYLSMHWD